MHGVSPAGRSAIMSVTHYVALSLLVAAASTAPLPAGAGLTPVQNSCQFSAGVGADQVCGTQDNNDDNSDRLLYPGVGVVVVPRRSGVGIVVGGAR